MTWEEKLAACQALGDTSLRMRKPGDWYVDCRGVEVKEGAMLVDRHGNGRTPQEAVEDHWRVLTELAPHEVIVLNAMQPTRREVRWNGYMWVDVAR